MLPGGLSGQRLDFLPVKLSRTAVVLGVGVTGGTAVLVEEGGLQRKADKLTEISQDSDLRLKMLLNERLKKFKGKWK